MAKKKTTTVKVNKSAIDGRFVKTEDVEKHPKTTYKQTVTKATKKK